MWVDPASHSISVCMASLAGQLTDYVILTITGESVFQQNFNSTDSCLRSVTISYYTYTHTHTHSHSPWLQGGGSGQGQSFWEVHLRVGDTWGFSGRVWWVVSWEVRSGQRFSDIAGQTNTNSELDGGGGGILLDAEILYSSVNICLGRVSASNKLFPGIFHNLLVSPDSIALLDYKLAPRQGRLSALTLIK